MGTIVTEAKANNVRETKERERRRKKYKFALVQWANGIGGWEDYPTIAVEHKNVLRTWWQSDYTILCDDQPEKVLRGMLKLMKENEDEI